MARVLKTGSAVRLLAGLAVMTGLVLTGSLLTETRPAFAAKPAPVPPGKIYHKFHSGAIKSMNGDGSSLTDALPSAAMNALTPVWAPLAYPSNQPSGERWWITTAQTGTYDTYTYPNGTTYTDYPHYDVVAVRRSPVDSTQLDVVQLTDFYGTLLIGVTTAYWSNDSNDAPSSFAGVSFSDLRDNPAVYWEDVDGTHVNLTGISGGHLRLPVTVSEIAAGNFGPYGDSRPYSDATLTNAEIDELLWPVWGGPYNRQGTISPAGDLVVAYNQKRLLIVLAAAPDYINPVQVLCDGNVTGNPQPMNQQQWSPNGLTIAFAADGNIWTVPASGGARTKILAGTSTSKYTVPIWSPDSKYVVAERDDYSGTTVVAKYLVRVPPGGGTIVTLRQIGNTGGPALRWVPSN